MTLSHFDGFYVNSAYPFALVADSQGPIMRGCPLDGLLQRIVQQYVCILLVQQYVCIIVQQYVCILSSILHVNFVFIAFCQVQ
jgi:hypothetical protein